MHHLLYNLKGIYFLLFSKKRQLASTLEHFFGIFDKDLEQIARRLHYYCHFHPISLSSYPKQSKKEILENGSRYAYDFYEFMRFFDPSLIFYLESGDVNYQTKIPSFCKSRPIANFPTNNILLKLDKKRHFKFLNAKDLTIPYAQKASKIFFRGGCYQEHRKRFMSKFFQHPLVDAGHVGRLQDPKLQAWFKGKASLKEHLKHKCILSLEGYDVATNLKWIMSSNSIAIMPKPKFETWFMEGSLRANEHFLCIKDDFSDLEERMAFILENPQLAQYIITNANNYVKEFFNQEKENFISLLVLRKFFYQTHQIEVSQIEEELFKAP